ncbi:MAG: heavy-metal-associated domain-containing protein, partial [Saprospiraceae bacterium]|nr:heavy-metal-associated domain-containing protein [Saprospiraceae bacterium]
MTHTYQISGMSCNGCRNHVLKTLSEVEGVTKIEVSLEEKSATIEMDRHIPLAAFKDALENDGGKYSIGSMHETM